MMLILLLLLKISADGRNDKIVHSSGFAKSSVDAPSCLIHSSKGRHFRLFPCREGQKRVNLQCFVMIEYQLFLLRPLGRVNHCHRVSHAANSPQ
jgi:hypothetical protein